MLLLGIVIGFVCALLFVRFMFKKELNKKSSVSMSELVSILSSGGVKECDDNDKKD